MIVIVMVVVVFWLGLGLCLGLGLGDAVVHGCEGVRDVTGLGQVEVGGEDEVAEVDAVPPAPH